MDGRGSRGRGSFGRRESGINPILLTSEEETKSFAKNLAKELIPGSVICLVGELGAGKTTFVKGLATFFGILEEIVSSPTFTYMNQYHNLIHFDLYRLSNEDQFLSMGFDEYFAPPFITCIEWPNILDKALPESYYLIELKHHVDGREILVKKITTENTERTAKKRE